MAIFEKEDGTYIIGEDDLLSKKELAEEIGMSVTTIQRLMRKGLPYTRFKTSVAFNKHEALDWLEDHGYGDKELIGIWNRKRQKNKEKRDSE